MGSDVFVHVEGDWRFDPASLLDALRQAFAGQDLAPGGSPLRLQTGGFLDSWGVEVVAGGETLVIQALPRVTATLLAWIRDFVPDDVVLSFFDEAVSFGVAPLAPGATAAALLAEHFPDWPEPERVSRPPEPGSRFLPSTRGRDDLGS